MKEGRVSSFSFLKHFYMQESINFRVVPQGKSTNNQLMLKTGSKRVVNTEIESGQGKTNRL